MRSRFLVVALLWAIPGLSLAACPYDLHGTATCATLPRFGRALGDFITFPGLFLGAFAAWVDFWTVAHFVEAYRALPASATDAVTTAVAQAYAHYPYTFIVGLLTTMLSVQLLALGILALQAKRYFEEIFTLGIHLNRRIIELAETE